MMIYNRPNFKEYVMVRLLMLAIILFLILSSALLFLIEDNHSVFLAILFLGIGFGTFVYAIYQGAGRMQKELKVINKYLSQLNKVDEINYKARFFTQEFEDINHNLMKVLKASKKREDIKQRYNAKLKLKNRQRADMISAIAHEFRNPIASIMGYSQTLVDDKSVPIALQEKFLDKIYNNGNKIESLLGRLVLWNKFESGEATLHPSRFNMYQLAEEIKSALREKYPNREIIIEGDSDYTVKADRTLLEVVLKNLMENALKYSKEEIKVFIGESGISVADKGIGISSSDIDKVTKKFYRSGTHSWDNSMGLGLSIVKSILSLHESKLDIVSQENKGSTFSFKL